MLAQNLVDLLGMEKMSAADKAWLVGWLNHRPIEVLGTYHFLTMDMKAFEDAFGKKWCPLMENVDRVRERFKTAPDLVIASALWVELLACIGAVIRSQ